MYNDKQKNEFLDTLDKENSRIAALKTFKNIEQIEKKFGKDLCEMSVDEVLVLIDLKTGTSLNSTENAISIFRKYVNWCIQSGRCKSENTLDKIDSSEADKTALYRQKYVKNPEEFEKMISVVFKKDASYNEDVEIPKELMIRLCYAGLDNDQIVCLKKDDVDYDHYTIDGFTVDDHVLVLCKAVSEMKFVKYPGRHNERCERLCTNDYIFRQRIGTLKGNSESKALDRTIVMRRVAEFSKRFSELESYKNITSAKLRTSGIFYQIFTGKNEMEDLKKYAAIGTKTEKRAKEKFRQILSEYNTWKRAFY